jgi:hypothetical protein
VKEIGRKVRTNLTGNPSTVVAKNPGESEGGYRYLGITEQISYDGEGYDGGLGATKGTVRYDLIKRSASAEDFPFLVLAPALSGSNRSAAQRFAPFQGRKLPVPAPLRKFRHHQIRTFPVIKAYPQLRCPDFHKEMGVDRLCVGLLVRSYRSAPSVTPSTERQLAFHDRRERFGPNPHTGPDVLLGRGGTLEQGLLFAGIGE